MLKKLLIILTLFAVIPAVCMHQVIRVPKTTVTIRTSDGQEFVVDKEQVKCSETLKNLLEDADNNVDQNGIPLPNITRPIWSKIQTLLPLVVEMRALLKKKEEEQTEVIQQRKREIVEELGAFAISYDGATLAELIAAFDYLDIQMLSNSVISGAKHLDHTNQIAFIKEALDLDIPILLDLANNVAKNIDTKKISFEQITAFPSEICNSIILGQMLRILGPMQCKQLHEGLDLHTVEALLNAPRPMRSVVISDNTLFIYEGDQFISEVVCIGNITDFTSACVTHDNKIISGSQDGTVRVWDMQGNLVAVWLGHRGSVDAVCVTHDNKIVSGSHDGTLRVWDMQGNQLSACNIADYVSSICEISENKIGVRGYRGAEYFWDISLLNRISTMDYEQVDAIWKYLQGDGAKDWNGIYKIFEAVKIW